MAPKSSAPSTALLRQARRVRLLLLDVDGVLTDGSLHYDGDGRETKAFFAQDGMALRLLREVSGIPTAIVSGRASAATESRARDLGIEEVHLRVRDKGEVLDSLLRKYSLDPEEVCGMGDDIVDLPFLDRVGLPLAPANAHPEAKRAALFVTRASGGRGAVREAVEILLRARGDWPKVLARFRR